jgi:broad specificity phosphatase PhoE
MKIYMITHAHTEQVRDVAVDSWTLSQRGAEQASKLAVAPFWASVTQIVVSAEQKTYLTVAEIGKLHSLPIWVDSRFDELRRAGWTENYAEQVKAVFADPTRSVAGWETAESVRQRALSGLADLQKRFEGETLALVGHGLCLSILRAFAMHSPLVDFHAWQRMAFGSYASISLNPLTLMSDFAISDHAVR